MKHTSKRISSGHYLYRGYNIIRYKSQGLMPNRQWVWEASDSQEVGVAHAHSLTMVKKLIDEMLDTEKEKKA